MLKLIHKRQRYQGKYATVASWHSYHCCLSLKGYNRQHSGQMSQIILKLKKTTEIQPVRPTEVCGEMAQKCLLKHHSYYLMCVY